MIWVLSKMPHVDKIFSFPFVALPFRRNSVKNERKEKFLDHVHGWLAYEYSTKLILIYLSSFECAFFQCCWNVIFSEQGNFTLVENWTICFFTTRATLKFSFASFTYLSCIRTDLPSRDLPQILPLTVSRFLRWHGQSTSNVRTRAKNIAKERKKINLKIPKEIDFFFIFPLKLVSFLYIFYFLQITEKKEWDWAERAKSTRWKAFFLLPTSQITSMPPLV